MTTSKNGPGHAVFTVIGIILCIILIPVLIINCTLLIKSYVNRDAVPNVGGVMPLIVLTDSMYPGIRSGDIIFCRTLKPEEVQVGDVIAFFDPAGNGSSIVTHRVVEITQSAGAPAWRTKGDNNNVEDQAVVESDDLVGRYCGVRVAGLGNVAMFMQTSAGLIVCVVLPLALLVGYDLLRRKAAEKKGKETNDELMKELEELRRLKAIQEAKAAQAPQPENGQSPE